MWKTTLKYKSLFSLTSNILGSYMRVFTSVPEFTAESTNAGADLGGGCRGAPPPTPWDDLRFSNTTGILQKKLCGLLVLK